MIDSMFYGGGGYLPSYGSPYGGSPYGSTPQYSMPQYGSPYTGSPYGGVAPQDPMQTFSFCMAILQPLMGFLTSLTGNSNTLPGELPPVNPEDVDPPADDEETLPEPERATNNTERLQLLAEYADEINSRNGGKITAEDLKKFAAQKGIPEAVKEAAREVSENKQLYNLLCLQSGNEPKKGFDKDLLEDEEWEDLNVDIDDLESFDDDREGNQEAVDVLKQQNVLNAIKTLNKDTSDTSADEITVKDLEAIALGEVSGVLDDPEVQAAALHVLSNKRLRAGLDAHGETDTAKQADGKIKANAFAEYFSNGSSTTPPPSNSGTAFTHTADTPATADKNKRALELLKDILDDQPAVEGVNYADGLTADELNLLKASTNLSASEKAAIEYIQDDIQISSSNVKTTLWESINGADSIIRRGDMESILTKNLDPATIADNSLFAT